MTLLQLGRKRTLLAALRYVTRSRACDGRHMGPGMEGQLAIMCDVADGSYVRRALTARHYVDTERDA
jgi:hypothetical protein